MPAASTEYCDDFCIRISHHTESRNLKFLLFSVLILFVNNFGKIKIFTLFSQFKDEEVVNSATFETLDSKTAQKDSKN